MKFVSSFKLKLIYVFRINDEVHNGCLKVGEATADDNKDLCGLAPSSHNLNVAAKKRINQYTQTAGIAYDLLYTELAIYTAGGRLCALNDGAVRDVLLRSGIKKKVFEIEGKANEWVITDLNTVKNAIKAAKEGRNSLNSSEVSTDRNPIVFRPEQDEAIRLTIKQFRKSNQFLWNAKMRFGKTLSALQVTKEMDFRRTLILTHRPVVDDGWFEDFGKIFYDTPSFVYGSKNNGDTYAVLEQQAQQQDKHYVYFASMQDLRGSEKVGGNFDKNNEIFATPWDFIIVDEAHEGTQTELGKAVMTELTKKGTKVLHLSGTPFNLLDDYKEDEIFTWDYVMEQRAKADWNNTHFGDSNPYASLPRLNIYTYNLGELFGEFADSELAFNFHEFFRVDEIGNFIHYTDVQSFLNLITRADDESNYPYSTKKYRDNFRHSLWMVPGVKEARALSALLQQHPVFSLFKIVNVAGDGDEEQDSRDALKVVENAIGDKPEETYTITLSCGRLTTGVSVKPWTAVMMLASSFSTSASSYMQTIFRVQTPATIGGKVKEECFVFDFAPDRTLKVIAETAKISAKAGKTSIDDRKIMGEFLNFCPIIAIDGSQMRTYDVHRMLEQLKKVYVERVIRNGFEDGYLYSDDLMKLTDVDLQEFDNLKKIIGSTKAMPKSGDIDMNSQGFNNEEYEQLEQAQKDKRHGKDLTDEQKQLLEDRAKKRKNKDTAVSILRGISIRMPLLIYGAELQDESVNITLDNFTSLIDPLSWEEFMPKGVSKQLFNNFKKYYDPDIFCAAGKRIRAMAKAADALSVEERIERITAIFATFRNPDKETVLTPWRVVNMHISDCMGGYVFYDELYEHQLTEPRFVEQGNVTANVFTPDTRILEINSKSGLYPLYVAYSVYRNRLKEQTDLFDDGSQDPRERQLRVWDTVLRENIFVLCKTPMAKSITKRTLAGFRGANVNTRYYEDLINQITNKSAKFIEQMSQGKSYWKANENNNMKFKAIVGNPPYQVMDGGGTGSSATPVYDKFVKIAKQLTPEYVSMIIPAKWYTGGKGLDYFRESMLNDKKLSLLFDYEDSRECFPTVDIAGGICYFLRDTNNCSPCKVTNIDKGKRIFSIRHLNEYNTFIRNERNLIIINKIKAQTSNGFLSQKVYSRKPFGIRSFEHGFPAKQGRNISLFGSDGITYIEEKDVRQNAKLIPLWKVIMSKASAEHAGQTDQQGRKRIISRLEVLPPQTICTESYLLLDVFEIEQDAINFKKYMQTQFVRFLLASILITQNIVRDKFRFIPLQDFTDKSDIDWTKSVAEIDRQLYAKYGLTDTEVAFIESTIKPME